MSWDIVGSFRDITAAHRTGDTAEEDTDGCWKILGRSSTDIIKSGGYKVSALQVTLDLLQPPLQSLCGSLLWSTVRCSAWGAGAPRKRCSVGTPGDRG